MRKLLRSWWWIAAAILLALALVWAVLWPLTDALAAHDITAFSAPARAAHLQSAREAVRTQFLTLGAGVFAAGALTFTARNSLFAQRTVQIAEQGQVTDRYTKAIEQLGSQQLDVRIGGIYALERVARDSARDHPTVIEVLTAFVRGHSHEQWPPAGTDGAVPDQTTRPDVQAAITVIGRRNLERDVQPCDLSEANLSTANLTGARLEGAFLTEAVLRAANLHDVKLCDAYLVAADLSIAFLNDADLSRANLGLVDLRGSDLTNAKLSDARLAGAHLNESDLTNATLTGAYLAGADLSQAQLTGATFSRSVLTGAIIRGTSLAGVDFTSANLTNADLSTSNVTGAILADANLTEAWFPMDAEIPEGWIRGPLGRVERVSPGHHDVTAEPAGTS